MEHHKAEVREVAARGSSGDDAARFLRELRQLRSGAGLGHAELAARAHYPHDSIRAAEAGPTLPALPVLAAYVRGCGGTSEEWEERWRSLTRSPVLPTLPTRVAGCSVAATAGARVGAAGSQVDGPNPSAVMAALDRVAEELAGMAETDEAPEVTQTADEARSSATAATPATLATPQSTAGTDPAASTLPAASTVAGPPARTAAAERLSLPPRALVAALAAIAVCVLVAVLAIFA